MAGGDGNGGGRTESFAMTEQQYVPAKVSVWWDIENCHVPRGSEPHLIAKNISSALVTMNYCGPVSINAYGDTTKISSSTQQALNSTGISLNHVPAGAKDASDKKILVDMLFWAVDNPAPANYLLISGDRDFSNALHQLQMRRYNILLAQPKQPSIHLIAAAKNVWLWSSLVTGGPPFTSNELSQFINKNGVSSTPGSVSMQTSQSGGDSLPQGNQRSTNNKNKGGSFIQPTISSTQTAVLGSQDDSNNGNPHNLVYGQNYSGNPSTVSISGSSPFFHTYHPDAFSNNGSNHPGYFENPYNMPVRPQTFPMHPPPPPPNFLPPLSQAHSMLPVFHQPNTFPFTGGPVTGTEHSDFSYMHHVHNGPNTASLNNQSPINGLNTAGSDKSTTINKPQKGKSVPKTAGSGSQSPVNKPQKGNSVPKTTGSDCQSTVKRPQKGKSVPKSTGSDSRSTVNNPQKGKTVPEKDNTTPNTAVNKFQECANVPSNGLLESSECPVPNEQPHALTRVVLLALETLKNEKIIPTEENIANCIKYGDPKHRETNLKKALRKAVYQQQLVVKQYLGASQLYVAKDDKLWKCVNLISGNMKDYSESVWDEVEKFLSSDSGRIAILATECRYEAATLMKKECLKELPLGKILQFLNMVIDYKKWIVPHESGWQPLEITFTGTNPVLVASSDADSN